MIFQDFSSLMMALCSVVRDSTLSPNVPNALLLPILHFHVTADFFF